MKKNILLLGDSIRQNYQEYVKENALDANVFFPNDNCRFSIYLLRYLHEWINALSSRGMVEFDLIHFNCGLWDVLRLSDDDLLVPPDMYQQYILRIINRIRYLCPKARIMFATSTSVIEPGFEIGGVYGKRCNVDIENYNKLAIDVCRVNNVYIDNLWECSTLIPVEYRSDYVHFDTAIGKKLLGDYVLKAIREWQYE